MSTRRTSRRTQTVPDEFIDSLFGKGWGYSEWKEAIERHPNKYTWTGALKNTIIRREFLFFKTEILRLKSETTIGHGRRDLPKSNSLETILKRLKGEPWMIGVPSERKQRLQDGRLLGKDAKIRSLQNYVRDWENDAQWATASFLTSEDQNAYGNDPPEAATQSLDWNFEVPYNNPPADTHLDDLFGGLTIQNLPPYTTYAIYPETQIWTGGGVYREDYCPNWNGENNHQEWN